jgi:hypothetical protein
MGEGQFRADDGLASRLDELDDQAVAALERGDEEELDRCLEVMWRLVESEGSRLPDDELAPSDVVIPPTDLTLEETRELFAEHGLIPELPA